MVDTITSLIEKAIQTDSDNEALTVLRQVRKMYRGTGTAVMPTRPSKNKDMGVGQKQLADVLRQHLQAIQELEAGRERLIKDNSRLSARNQELEKQVLVENIKADEKVLDDAKKVLGHAMRLTVLSVVVGIVAVAAVAVLVV